MHVQACYAVGKVVGQESIPGDSCRPSPTYRYSQMNVGCILRDLMNFPEKLDICRCK